MNDPAIFQIVTAVIFAVVLSLLMAERKQPARHPSPKGRADARPRQEMEPTYCFNDCMRIQGQSKGMFCGVACGLKGTR
jgi:hypothetical protein